MSHPDPDAFASAPLAPSSEGAVEIPVEGHGWQPVPESPAVRRRNRVVLALSALVVVLLAAGGVLTALLVDARTTASDLAAEEAAEERAHADALAGVETERADVLAAIADAEDDAADAQDRIQAAQQAQASAEAQAAAVEESQAAATAHAESAFLESMRDVFPGASDATLLDRGYGLCEHLDTLYVATVYNAYDHATEVYGYEYDEALLMATAAVVMFCPEYDY
ncbi:DUF732 domain-containing protein [Blastococcus sp. URHD0036]|uniref:DUF732 domain-containing protein n=1 Tax=Blastococcus sp. URHD0036 TaxID=1380356 RepID=UPI0004950238|nr:DUF732 domain-containing protein [Blastococcus sp. URHD0036]